MNKVNEVVLIIINPPRDPDWSTCINYLTRLLIHQRASAARKALGELEFDQLERLLIRARRPRRHGWSTRARKFTPDQVVQIRNEYATGDYTYRELSKKYGVSAGTISNIVLRRQYPEIIGGPDIIEVRKARQLAKQEELVE